MRRVLGILLVWPVLCFGQYADTIKGRITVKYNNPYKMKVSVLAGGSFETQSLDGGVMLPCAFADVHLRPSKWFTLHGAVSQQFQIGWQHQKIQDTRNLEFGGRLFFTQHFIDKTKTFTAGTRSWNYDFLFPVKVLWNVGASGSYRFGTGVFNTGTDPNTRVQFRNTETQEIEFLERAAVPYTFSEISGGFVVSTSSNMKLLAHMPVTGEVRARRMKTYTEFRLEAIYGNKMQMSPTIDRQLENSTTGNYIHYDVLVGRSEKIGFKMQGMFRRKWFGLKIEAGVRPGVYYRFAGAQRNSPMDRSYMILSMGFGWM